CRGRMRRAGRRSSRSARSGSLWSVRRSGSVCANFCHHPLFPLLFQDEVDTVLARLVHFRIGIRGGYLAPFAVLGDDEDPFLVAFHLDDPLAWIADEPTVCPVNLSNQFGATYAALTAFRSELQHGLDLTRF